VHHPAEILKGLKTCTYDGLKKHGKKWLDELPCALWGNRTTPSRAMGETSFFMVYGTEAVLSSEVTMGSLRVKTYDEATQDQFRHEDIDLVDERRWQAAIKNARYRQALRHYHQRFVQSRELQVDDLVLRRVLIQEGMNKLSPLLGRSLPGNLSVPTWMRPLGNGGGRTSAVPKKHRTPP
jgi:hypothetical protein